MPTSWETVEISPVLCATTACDGRPAGIIELKDSVSLVALKTADRSKIRIVFFDLVDPKSFTGEFPEPMPVSYTIKAVFKKAPQHKDPDKTLSMTLPVAVAPVQVPRLAAAGIALSDYIKDEGYSAVKPRKKVLWVEFEEPVANPDDDYFVFVKAYAPDSLLLANNEPVEDPKENIPYLPAELIRVITDGQPDDKAGLNAWQKLIPAKPASEGNPVRHFMIPLPPGLNASSDELFGFFVCEFCVGHSRVWSTAQARFGRAIRITGIQHPAPQLVCLAERRTDAISVTAPYANPVYNAVASIIVKDEKKGAEVMDNSLMKEIGLGGNNKLVENEIEILKSYDLMEAVVNRLQLYVSVRHMGRIRDVEVQLCLAALRLVICLPCSVLGPVALRGVGMVS